MTYEIYDNWDNQIVRKGLSFGEVQDFLQLNEPPRMWNGLPRYNYWPVPFSVEGVTFKSF